MTKAAVVGEVGTQLGQGRERVAQVLEHVGGDDRVEPLVAELGVEVELVEVADDHPLAEFFGPAAISSSSSIPTTVQPRSIERLRHIAGSRTELEDPRVLADQPDDVGVDASDSRSIRSKS